MNPTARTLRILVVEDSSLSRAMALGLLARLGHAATGVADGAGAAAAVEANPFELVLMDLELPDMDGFDAADTIRARCPELPIVAMTGHKSEAVRARCLDAGMVGHLGKPVRAEDLADVLARLFPETIDWTGARRAVGGDDDLLRRIVDAFRDEAPRLLDDLKAALAAGDSEALRRAAHTLHGSMRYLDTPDVHAHARDLEQAAETADWDAARRLVPRLADACARILPAVDRFLREA